MNAKVTTKSLPRLGAFLLLLALPACGGSDGNRGAGDAGTNPNEPATTPVGTDNGTPASATIGTAGGTLSSADGKLTITIPPGALTTDTALGIQPITNTAHGGLGAAFRLTPEGQTFAQPVQLGFAYTSDDLAGSDPQMLGASFQNAEGYWQWLGTPLLDATNQTVSVSVGHFTDFSMVKGYRLQPGSKSVHVNETQALQVVICYAPAVKEDDPQPLGYACDGLGSQGELSALAPISDWSVNGVPGGGSTTGTVSGNGADASFQAPATAPTPNTVAVSARIDLGALGLALVVSNITITDQVGYTGTVTFSTNLAGAVVVTGALAEVKWTQFEDLGDTRRYVPSGTIKADSVSLQGCDTLTNVTVPIEATVPGGPGPTLVVYTATNSAFANSHQFGIAADDTSLTFMCGTDPNKVAVPTPASGLFAILVGGCTGVTLPFTDETHLSGTYQCPAMGLDASWDFTQ